jgi:type III pantothenate kinase
MLTTVCIGNTSIYIGFFVDDEPLITRLPTRPFRTADDYGKAIEEAAGDFGLGECDAGLLVSVVPPLNEPMKSALKHFCGGKTPLVVTHKLIKDMKFAVKNPEIVGADRITASYAAWKLFGGPIAVIDLGTATTVNFVSADGLFLGGAIMPGLALMRDSLKERTAKLPRVDLVKPAKPMGTDTTGSILAGIVYGTAGAIGRLIEEAELERLESFKIALTGGHSDVIKPCLRRLDHHEPSLVLKGMRLIHLAAEKAGR